ncbi:MAG: hypothetical protein QXD03_05055 [Candidatus Anstonellales archaeon]
MISSNTTLTLCIIDSDNSPKMMNFKVTLFSDLNDVNYIKEVIRTIFDRYNSKMIIGSNNSFNLKFKPIHKILVDDYVTENLLALCNYIAKDIFDTWNKISTVKISNLSTDPVVTYIYNKNEN